MKVKDGKEKCFAILELENVTELVKIKACLVLREIDVNRQLELSKDEETKDYYKQEIQLLRGLIEEFEKAFK